MIFRAESVSVVFLIPHTSYLIAHTSSLTGAFFSVILSTLIPLPMDTKLSLRVNGKLHSVTADPATPLLYILRNQLALNGPKYGCGIQLCGACMVLLDGKAQPSCVISAGSVINKSIVTLEGLTQPDGTLHPVQEAFVKEQAAQCGYCLNGMVISAVSLLKENPKPDDTSIRAGLQRSLCRCGTQSRIIKAVKTAAANAK